MKKLILFSLILCRLNSFSQILYLETFNTKESIKGWNIKSNGVVKLTDHFTYNGETFYKKTKDSFLIFYDTAFKLNYRFSLSKTFKAIPAEELKFRHSMLSPESSQDYFSFACRIFDKKNETLFAVPFPQYCHSSPVAIIGGNLPLEEKEDTLWQRADSMTITYIFSPTNPGDSLERLVVIDEIFLNRVYASVNTLGKGGFEVYPNPASRFIYFKYDTNFKPRQIQLYDYTGKLVTASKGEERINVENLEPGLYFVTIQFENGTMATKKIEIN